MPVCAGVAGAIYGFDAEAKDRGLIFLGIFWSRIGTPTGRYASGTVEEFELAYDKWQKAKESVTLMIYFKEAALSPHDLDTDQLAQIQRLRSRLPSSGGLYWTFKTVDEFETTVRLHLTRVVQDWRPPVGKSWVGADSRRSD
jgi:hypothetical protein